jgi:hypothetical protein
LSPSAGNGAIRQAGNHDSQSIIAKIEKANHCSFSVGVISSQSQYFI